MAQAAEHSSSARDETGTGVSATMIYALFFLSGISGLMYQVVWVRMLGRVLGNTVFATSTILAVYMLGLALGSYIAGRYIDRMRRPLRGYAMLELGIALSAALSAGLAAWPVPIYRAICEATDFSRGWLLVGQLVAAALFLLAPTTLMGATLPALTAFAARRGPSFSRTVGTLYAVNTLGAMLGALTSGFEHIGAICERSTILLGVLMNVGVGIMALRMSRAAGEDGQAIAAPSSDAPAPAESCSYGSAVRWTVLACFGISGLVIVALEVVWSRMLVLYQDTSIYSFSAVLTVVLAGIGAGSLIGGRLAGRSSAPLRLLARLELGISLAVLLGLVAYVHLSYGLFIAPLMVVGPVTLLSGIAFPVAARCYRQTEGAGRSVGTLYAWNTVGCILGAIIAGFVLIPRLGSSQTAVLLGGASGVIGVVLFIAAARSPKHGFSIADLIMGVVVIALLFNVDDPYREIMYRRIAAMHPAATEVYLHVEDATAATTAFGTADKKREGKQLWVNGYGMTTLLSLTKLMAHVPVWLADEPKEVLVICFGMGTTFRSGTLHEDLNITAVELVPSVADCFGFYHADAEAVRARPNAKIVIDDGRNYLDMRSQQYDVITIDPAPPLHSAGSVNLYTREFFELCKSRLRPGGVMCLWIPPAEESEVAMIARTYVDVFEHVSVWSPLKSYPGLYLMGTLKPVTGLADRIEKGFAEKHIAADLVEWDDEFTTAKDIQQLYVCDGSQLRETLSGVSIITDDRPWTEFPLWRKKRLGAQPILDGNRLFEMVDAKFPGRRIALP